MRLAKHQRGMGVVGWFFVLALVGFVALFAVKLVPVYMEYFTIRSVMQGFNTEAASYTGIADVRRAVEKRFNVNNVNDVTADDVLIEPAPGGFTLTLDYEARVPFIANIALVVRFSELAEARGGSESAQ